MSAQDERSPEPRQHVEKIGRRRARLTPVEGTEVEPHVDSTEPPPRVIGSGPNDARMRQDVPPHY